MNKKKAFPKAVLCCVERLLLDLEAWTLCFMLSSLIWHLCKKEEVLQTEGRLL